MKDIVAVVCKPLNLGERKTWAASRKFLDLWFRGITLKTTEFPRSASLGDYPAVRDQLDAASAEPDRMAGSGKFFWYWDGIHPDNLRARPCQLRWVHEGSDPARELGGVLDNPDAKYGLETGIPEKNNLSVIFSGYLANYRIPPRDVFWWEGIRQ